MKKPNFFIIGAPKCGTTSLAKWLSEHPQIYMPELKEPHFFSRDLNNRAISDERRYEKLFEAGETSVACGEASTWYLFSREAVPEIERRYPRAKYIVMVRNPVEMAVSLFQHNRRSLYERCTRLEDAWAKQEARQSGEEPITGCPEPKFLQYREACSLADHVQRLGQQVEPARVLVLSLSTMKRDPRSVYLSALKFLDLPDDERKNFTAHNAASGYRSRLLQRLIRLGGRTKHRLGWHTPWGLSRINSAPIDVIKLEPSFRATLESELSNQYLPEWDLLPNDR